jgi:hypothetical protein
MTKRRSLTEGLKPKKPDPKTEAAFVNGKPAQKTVPEQPAPAETLTPAATAKPRKAASESTATPVQGRSPLTTRLRSDLADALKRASLERQLSKVTPNTVQDILEEALEPWLRTNGYLK